MDSYVVRRSDAEHNPCKQHPFAGTPTLAPVPWDGLAPPPGVTAALEGMFAPGWHHKWLALAVMLGWVFLNRFRLLGLAIAKLLTLKLAYDRDTAALEITVRVERMTLQPLQLVGVEISSGEQWGVAFSKVTLRSFVREFFRSFGQVRILALEVESVKASVGPMDDAYVDKLIKTQQDSARRKAAAAAAAAQSTKPGSALDYS